MKSLEEFLLEAELLDGIPKSDRLGLYNVGLTISNPSNIGASYQRRNSWTLSDKRSDRNTKHVSTLHGLHIYHTVIKGHPEDEYRRKAYEDAHIYTLHDPKTNMVHMQVVGHKNQHNVMHVEGLASSGKSPVKAQDFYHHLLKHHITALVGTSHSEGGRKVWNRLAAKKTVSVHGWDDNKKEPVNIDATNPDETHSSYSEKKRHLNDAPEYPSVWDHTYKKKQKAREDHINVVKSEFDKKIDMPLVASYHPLKKLKVAAKEKT